MKNLRVPLIILAVLSVASGGLLILLLTAAARPPALYVNGTKARGMTYSWRTPRGAIEADSRGLFKFDYDDHTANARHWKPIRLRNAFWPGLRRNIAVTYYLVEDTQAPENDPERFIDDPHSSSAHWTPTGRLLAPATSGRYVAAIKVSYWGLTGSGIAHYGILVDVY